MIRRLATVAAFSLLLATPACGSLRSLLAGGFTRPNFAFKRVALADWSFEGVDLGLVYELDNPNDVAVDVAKVEYELSVEGKRIFTGAPNQGLQIRAGEVQELTFPARVRFAELLPALDAVFGKKRLGWQAKGSVGLSTPLGLVEFPLSRSGVLLTPELPQLEITRVSVPDLTGSGARVNVGLRVTNPNSFPLALEALDYALALNGTQVATGVAPGTDVAPARSRELTVPVTVSFARAGAAIPKLLAGGAARVGLSGRLDLGRVSGPLQVSKQVTIRR